MTIWTLSALAAAFCVARADALNALNMTVEETLTTLTGFYMDGSAYGADPISQLNHGLQTAFQAEKVYGYADDRVIAGALLHDIGWKLCGYSNNGVDSDVPQDSIAARLGIVSYTSSEELRARHDKVGGTYLRMLGFPDATASIAEGHVQAKRYLTFKESDYYDKLSAGSKRTLAFQGGPMTAEEAAAFEAHPSFELFKDSRRWDEGAKQPALNDVMPTWDYYLAKLEAVLREASDAPVTVRPKPLIESPRSTELLAQWQTVGYVRLKRDEWSSEHELQALRDDVDDLEAKLPEHSRTFEVLDDESVVMSRSERFVDHPRLGTALRRLLTGGTVFQDTVAAKTPGQCQVEQEEGECLPPAMAETSSLVRVVELLNLGAPVALYKEKVNYKRGNGGGGYLPHQDHYVGLGVPQYESPTKRGFLTFVCMIALDASTKENGCPEIAPTTWARKEGWIGYGPTEQDQMPSITDATSTQYRDAKHWGDFKHMGPFIPVEQEAGELLVYDNFQPHRSGANNSPLKRRALFGVFYDPAQVTGRDLRAEYYGNETAPGGRRHDGSKKDGGKANLFHTGRGVVLPEVHLSSS